MNVLTLHVSIRDQPDIVTDEVVACTYHKGSFGYLLSISWSTLSEETGTHAYVDEALAHELWVCSNPQSLYALADASVPSSRTEYQASKLQVSKRWQKFLNRESEYRRLGLELEPVLACFDSVRPHSIMDVCTNPIDTCCKILGTTVTRKSTGRRYS